MCTLEAFMYNCISCYTCAYVRTYLRTYMKYSPVQAAEGAYAQGLYLSCLYNNTTSTRYRGSIQHWCKLRT